MFLQSGHLPVVPLGHLRDPVRTQFGQIPLVFLGQTRGVKTLAVKTFGFKTRGVKTFGVKILGGRLRLDGGVQEAGQRVERQDLPEPG
jgi:hypothetical protein